MSLVKVTEFSLLLLLVEVSRVIFCFLRLWIKDGHHVPHFHFCFLAANGIQIECFVHVVEMHGTLSNLSSDGMKRIIWAKCYWVLHRIKNLMVLVLWTAFESKRCGKHFWISVWCSKDLFWLECLFSQSLDRQMLDMFLLLVHMRQLEKCFFQWAMCWTHEGIECFVHTLDSIVSCSGSLIMWWVSCCSIVKSWIHFGMSLQFSSVWAWFHHGCGHWSEIAIAWQRQHTTLPILQLYTRKSILWRKLHIIERLCCA